MSKEQLLQEAILEMSYLKMGIYGEAGSGKTYTASKIAIGLHQLIKSKKAVSFLDTETGSDFMIPVFKRAGIKFLTAKTRAFKDLLEVIRLTKKTCDILIIDSITHIWNEMVTAYCKEKGIPRMSLPHWQPVKQTWGEFTSEFINSPLHIIMAGRSADKWTEVVDDEGIKELTKVGTKMRAEGQISYEPSLLVEMEQVHKNPTPGAGWIHRAWVIKDRWNEETKLEGQHFDNPTFESFLPHIELLNLGGKHRAIDADRNSQELFQKGSNGYERMRQRDIFIEKINAEIYVKYPGQSVDDKQGRSNLMNEIFKTRSWTEVKGLPTKQLHQGLDKLEKSNGKNKESKDKKEKTK